MLNWPSGGDWCVISGDLEVVLEEKERVELERSLNCVTDCDKALTWYPILDDTIRPGDDVDDAVTTLLAWWLW